jgi:hypothetical protein
VVFVVVLFLGGFCSGAVKQFIIFFIVLTYMLLHLVCIWSASGLLLMSAIDSISGLHLDCIWTASGLHLDCIWSGSGFDASRYFTARSYMLN